MTLIDSLALLTLKCAPNVFDLSADMSHASIRDQVVRARLLARDLAALPQPPRSVLVVGAGFAGVSAALTLAKAGIAVTVVEVNSQPFQLQSSAQDRYIAPFMYEWPSHGADDQRYPPQWPVGVEDDSILAGLWDAADPAVLSKCWHWKAHRRLGIASAPSACEWREAQGGAPLPAPLLAQRARDRLTLLLNTLPSPPKIQVCVQKAKVAAFVTEFAKRSGKHYRRHGTAPVRGVFAEPWQKIRESQGCSWPSLAQSPFVVDVDIIILGGGLGQEGTELPLPPSVRDDSHRIVGRDFWDSDDWLNASANDRVGVFGGGDGALQDALRALTGDKHPLCTLQRMYRTAGAQTALSAVEPRLLAFEQEARLAATWSQAHQAAAATSPRLARANVDRRLDLRCAKLARALARQAPVTAAVESVLRNGDGEVVHLFRERYFTKSYLLNRFLLHLIHACQPLHSRFPGKVGYRKLPGQRLFHGYAEQPATGGTGPQKFHVFSEPAHPDSALEFDRVSVRLGAAAGPGRQMVGLSTQRIAERTCLGAIAYPLVADPMP
ncbi:FAD dependent oxidoreductase [Lysobacter enzymogenes]|uniref:FAD dependent oxidoreductase n=1 Tax=Lysobacter enzymogenes TaxID=69 RepID=A0A0S2DBR9_LYSEN|nr:FAD-dependent oxidoreductase [Lysobacter enzymogenes]ALN55970.1 FAD dependent oxidoreductase [Lysobacter enzymogenes]QCW24917.1 FAD-dependent oxidoreductase [Lysobacter enzymogenes]